MEKEVITFPIKICENIKANRYKIPQSKEFKRIKLMPIRKKNSKRLKLYEQFISKLNRKFIETICSCINALFPKKIHAVTLEGFIMKIRLFVLSYNIKHLLKVAG